MESSRRRFLKMAGVSALGLGPNNRSRCLRRGRPCSAPGYHVKKFQEDALSAKQWAMVIDTRKLQHEEDLEPIIDACNKIHNIPGH
jgi:hypothetical protein